MSDTLDEIRKQREVGEDARAEFEEVELSHRGVGSPNSEDVAGELVVFANADGSVVIGVDDDRVVRGISADRSGDVERWLIEMVRVAGRTRAEGNESNCAAPLAGVTRTVRGNRRADVGHGAKSRRLRDAPRLWALSLAALTAPGAASGIGLRA